MDIVVSHQLTDFDGLGAMVAASKLYPDSKAVFVGELQSIVRDFLVLYKDEIETYQLDEINLDIVKRIIIVDTYRKEMLADLKDKIDWTSYEVIIYDHHSHQKQKWVDLDLSENVGSATTILINRIIVEDIKLNPFEATVCALAIYADTGNLTYLNTTSADAKALAYLLDAGANLKIINDFIKESLDDDQQKLLENLLETREDFQIDGMEISLFPIEYNEYVSGINQVIEKLKLLYHLDNLFIIFSQGENIEIIGRSSDKAVDIGKICAKFNGGGHTGAGAARITGSLQQILDKLKKVITQQVHPLTRIRKIMTSPVRTVTPDTTIKEVEEKIKKYGHNGLVVVKDDKIKGIFSRRDINKVKGHNLMHAPVKAYMTKDVVTIDVECPVEKAQELMVEYGVGRLPVVEKGKLVGIVTRSDVLSSYYGDETPFQHKHRYGSSMVNINYNEKDISKKLNNLPGKILDILKKIGKIADDHHAEAFLIGGMVRDLLTGRRNNDIDVVVNSSLENIIHEIAETLGGEWTYNYQFKTGNVKLPSGYNLDMALTRKEIYHYTGALPEVEETNMLEDLFRRDYTVNVLAININPDMWGLMIDYFNAEKDLEEKKLQALHRFSFLDDPTRIIRGIRLAIKLGFKFEKETKVLIEETIKMGDFSRLSPERVIKELELLFKIKLNNRLINIIAEIPVFRLLNLDIDIKNKYKKEIKTLESFLEQLAKKKYNIEEWIVRMAIFTEDITIKQIQDWSIKDKYKDILTVFNRYKNLSNKLEKDIGPVKLVNMLNPLRKEELVLLYIKTKNRLAKNNIKKYIDKLQKVKISINGYDLQKLGLNPGPSMKEVLEEIYRARLRKEISDREEEIQYAKYLIKCRKIKE